MSWSRAKQRIFALTFALTLTGATAVTGAVGAGAAPARTAAGLAGSPSSLRSASTTATVTTPVTYSCFVTYQGGSTIVSYPLTFSGTAPDTVAVKDGYTASVSLPPITPNPSINTSVRDVRLVLTAPAGAKLLSAHLTGGAGLGPAGAQLALEGGSAVLTAAGPFIAGTPFTLPTVVFRLKAKAAGSGSITAGGVTLSDPGFSWVRTDPADGVTQRPFACFTDPVAVTATTLS